MNRSRSSVGGKSRCVARFNLSLTLFCTTEFVFRLPRQKRAVKLPRQGTSRTSTQSSAPSAWVPGVVKLREPVGENGEPWILVNVPTTGLYQRAVTGPLSWLISTVTVRAEGT